MSEKVIALPNGPTKAAEARKVRECPFAGVAVPQEGARRGEVFISMARSECGPSCALYDREKDRACLDRVLDFAEVKVQHLTNLLNVIFAPKACSLCGTTGGPLKPGSGDTLRCPRCECFK